MQRPQLNAGREALLQLRGPFERCAQAAVVHVVVLVVCGE